MYKVYSLRAKERPNNMSKLSVQDVVKYFETAPLDLAQVAFEFGGKNLQARLAIGQRLAKARQRKPSTSTSTSTTSVSEAGTTAVASASPKKRVRRTKAQIEADNAKLAAQRAGQVAEPVSGHARHAGEPAARAAAAGNGGMSMQEQEDQLEVVAEG